MSEDYLPDDDSGDEGYGELRVNFSDKEASSKALDPIPRGKYYVKIFDITLASCGSQSKNPGKPYWNLECVVQDGPHEGRHLFTNVMLFNPALYSLSQMMKALGYDIQAGSFRVPNPDTLIGQEMIVKVRIKPETDEYDARNEINGFLAYDSKTPANAGEASLLP